MGSLMAGWDSPIMDENTARVRRNKSLTKEEINAFWRSKSQRKNDEDEWEMHFSPLGSPVKSPGFLTGAERRKAATPFSRSQKDIWLVAHSQSVPNSPDTNQSNEEITPKSNKTGDWWTRSNWAFLNEPPRDEMHGAARKYTAQFNIARLATGNA